MRRRPRRPGAAPFAVRPVTAAGAAAAPSPAAGAASVAVSAIPSAAADSGAVSPAAAPSAAAAASLARSSGRSVSATGSAGAGDSAASAAAAAGGSGVRASSARPAGIAVAGATSAASATSSAAGAWAASSAGPALAAARSAAATASSARTPTAAVSAIAAAAGSGARPLGRPQGPSPRQGFVRRRRPRSAGRRAAPSPSWGSASLCRAGRRSWSCRPSSRSWSLLQSWCGDPGRAGHQLPRPGRHIKRIRRGIIQIVGARPVRGGRSRGRRDDSPVAGPLPGEEGAWRAAGAEARRPSARLEVKRQLRSSLPFPSGWRTRRHEPSAGEQGRNTAVSEVVHADASQAAAVRAARPPASRRGGLAAGGLDARERARRATPGPVVG